MDEYVLMASLDNPHIAKTYEVGAARNQPGELQVRNVLLWYVFVWVNS